MQGGSTITQQYVKNIYLTNERSVERKLNEAVLATRLERDLTDQLGSQRAAKEEILYRYLNTDLLRQRGLRRRGRRPVATSARTSRTSTSPRRPRWSPSSRRRPSTGPATTCSRPRTAASQVLDEMHDQGMISDAQCDRRQGQVPVAAGFGDPGRPTTPVYPPPDNGASQYPYFVDYVRQLPDRQVRRPGQERRGLALPRRPASIETTDRPPPPAAGRPGGDRRRTARPSTTPSIRSAMSLVSRRPVDRLREGHGRRPRLRPEPGQPGARRQARPAQPGSSMKPYTMATALEQGITPDTVLPGHRGVAGARLHQVARPTGCVIHGEAAVDHGPGHRRVVSNTYFAQLAYDVGPNNIAKMANRLGREQASTPTRRTTTSPSRWAPRAVSPLDQAVGYATFENHGVQQRPDARW